MKLSESQLGALKVVCPRCEAKPGKKCVRKTSRQLNTIPHPERVKAAKES